ncbi:hypothetical protein H072_7526 [Dactylellina haptotyla CBS 200.50]|uniref:Peptidase A1 domain-containing protein n=1 Tax=Dactylellina haptotyla (strain CBS 200.50) TaxID=1284197 RepID=S8AC86_DACHA|nr:hypothetical protein H072_7526 [Dactylellina haptotyla CBS 200.50]
MKSRSIIILSALQLVATAPTHVKWANQAGSVSVKWGAAGFLGEFTIGGQAVDLLVDTGSCGLWVVGPDASECSSQTHCYNPRNAQRVSSSTVSGFRQSYVDGLKAEGNTVVTDVFGAQKDNGFQIQNQYVEVANNVDGDNGKPLWEDKNGLVGMCRAGHANTSPKRLDTLPTTTGNFDYWTSYLKNGDEDAWSLCFGCMVSSSQYDSSSGATVKAIDDGNWKVSPSRWSVAVTQDGQTDKISLGNSGDILLDTGTTLTSLNSDSVRAIAHAYGGSCNGNECEYPCYVHDDNHADGSATNQDVKVTLPWGDGGIPFAPEAFWRGGYSCHNSDCTCSLGLKMRDEGYTYGSAVYKSGYFKWDVRNAEITVFRYN